MSRSSLFALSLVVLPCLAAWSQDDRVPVGIRAGQEAYQQAEAQRRAAVGAQVELNQILRNRLPWMSPYGETIYYAPPGYSVVGGYSTPYGTGLTMHRGYGYSPQSYLGATAAFGPGSYIPYPSLFAWSDPPPPLRQPIGQRQVQTGPRRWESFPIYADDVEAPAPPPPAPRPAPPIEVVPEEPVVKPRRGPREF
jgi:hypothetical protein